MARGLRTALVAAAALAGCGGGSDKPKDASPDTPPDTAPGMCGADVFFTGELIDWGSTEAKFCGVFNSALSVPGQVTAIDTSNPNGRFELCIAHQAQTVVNVVHGSNVSQCPGITGNYPGQARLIAEQAVIDGNGLFSARAMTMAAMTKFYGDLGQAYNANQGQLVVHVNGAHRAVSLSTINHSPVWQFNGATWEAGTATSGTGSDVFFPNVAVDAAVKIDVAGGAIGTTTITLEPGVFTYVSVIAN